MNVEFLPGEDPDEEPDERERSHRRSGCWVLAALLAAGVMVWALTRPAPPRGHGRPPVPAVSTRADSACDGIPHCAVRASVPAAIAQLARAYLPPGARLSVRTVVTVGSLTRQNPFLERDVDAFFESVTVLIRVQRGGSGALEIAPDPPGLGSLLLHQDNSGFVVRLQYLAPETVPPMLARLEALMRDPRLTSG